VPPVTLPDHLADAGFEVSGIDAFTAERVVAFVDSILQDDCCKDAHRELERSVGKFFDDFSPDRRFFLALKREGALCAFTAIDRYKDDTATLKWIFVSRDCRGQGIGSWLLDEALAFAHGVGYEKAILCTATNMEAAHLLYKSRGFVFKQWVTFWRQRMQVFENVFGESVAELAE